MHYFWLVTQLLAGSAVKFAFGANVITTLDQEKQEGKQTRALRGNIKSSLDLALIKGNNDNTHMVTPNQYNSRNVWPCMCDRSEFDAGWGDCDTYQDGAPNHDYCYDDKMKGYYALYYCSECNQCVDIPSYELVGSTYATCGGTYTMSIDLLHGRNIWDREDNLQFVFWCPSSRMWAITGSQLRQDFLDGKITHCGAFIHSSNGPDNWYDADWSKYNGAVVVEKIQKGTASS